MPSDINNKLNILLLGVNHKTAPVEIREKLALRETNPPALKLFHELPACMEVVFLSTCNRVEVIVGTNDIERARDQILEVWQSRSGITDNEFSECTYEYRGIEAVRHVFRVAASLDSMVVGEPQILGQLKDAYRNASEEGCSGHILNKLMHKAFSTAKRIRTETRIASQAVSISYAAVELAKKIFGDLRGKSALMVGAGEMAELAAQHLKTNGIERLIVANRTLERAMELASSLDGEAVSLAELEDVLVDADIVISSTGAPGLVITKDQVKRIMRPRRHRLLFFIDIAVPRDIDPRVNDIDNVYLFDIDELKEVVEENKAERQKEALRAERIVESEVIKFKSWMQSLDIIPIIKKLQEKAENVRQKELRRTLKNLKGLSDKERQAVEKLSQSLVNKILHDPIIFLKKGSKDKDKDDVLAMVCRIFALNGAGETISFENYMKEKNKLEGRCSSKQAN